MTREEAIDVLKHNYPSSCYEDLCKAVDMAIKALEQPEPCEDTISRQMAINALCKRCDLVSDDEPCTEDCNDIKILKMLPSAQPETAENLYMYKCYITDKDGLQHEVIHTDDIRRVTGWEI